MICKNLKAYVVILLSTTSLLLPLSSFASSLLSEYAEQRGKGIACWAYDGKIPNHRPDFVASIYPSKDMKIALEASQLEIVNGSELVFAHLRSFGLFGMGGMETNTSSSSQISKIKFHKFGVLQTGSLNYETTSYFNATLEVQNNSTTGETSAANSIELKCKIVEANISPRQVVDEKFVEAYKEERISVGEFLADKVYRCMSLISGL